MKEIKRKQMLDSFCKRLNQDFDRYCQRHKQQENVNSFITYLIDRDIIPNTSIRRYTILEEFEDLYTSKQLKKTQVVHTLADKFNITPRSIWNMLRDRK